MSGDRAPVALPLFLLASVGVAVWAMVAATKKIPASRETKPTPLAVAAPVAPSEPIASEAQVFRTTPGMLAIQPETRREREAHPRTLRTFHYLRDYPGAPPRIPHGLTAMEFRTNACNTCHERGGYSRRFEAYVPVTPHPERTACLQCHVPDDRVVGSAGARPNARCHLCHGSGGPPQPFDQALLKHAILAWPALSPKLLDGSPPPISHTVEDRGNCLPCHAGPSAVAEIRTSHPEWTDCRQCHVVPGPDERRFVRPAADSADGHGGAR
jgi:cytochrome c-type protein NapB